MKAYLDNDVVSAIAKDDTAGESDALDRLLAAGGDRKVELVTSELTLDEIKRYSGPARKQVERIFRLLEKAPVVRWDELRGMHSYGDSKTWITSPLIQNDPRYDSFAEARRSTLSTCSSQLSRPATPFSLATGRDCPRRGYSEACVVAVQRPSVLVHSEGW